jgi:hypothetical protein
MGASRWRTRAAADDWEPIRVVDDVTLAVDELLALPREKSDTMVAFLIALMAPTSGS